MIQILLKNDPALSEPVRMFKLKLKSKLAQMLLAF